MYPSGKVLGSAPSTAKNKKKKTNKQKTWVLGTPRRERVGLGPLGLSPAPAQVLGQAWNTPCPQGVWLNE